MERQSSNHDAEKKRSSTRISTNELLKDVPPVAILSLHEISSYSINDESDAVRFTKGLKPDDCWLNKADDDIAPVTPLLSEGLMQAVKALCDSVPNVYFEGYGTEGVIEERLKTLLYRSVRELIDNAVKHAFSSHIFVQVIIESGFVSVTVYDDGKSFDPETAVIGTGLGNIATAVTACKGKMNIHSSPEKGTEINIEIER